MRRPMFVPVTAALRRSGPFPRRQRGVTLIELIMVLVIMAVLLALAAPSFADTIRNNRLASQVNRVVYGLNLARSEAVKRATPVTLCKSSSGIACTTTSEWEQGWILFSDPDGDQVYDSDESLLRVDQALIAGYSLRGSAAVADAVTFHANGTSLMQGSFVLCLDNQLHAARLAGVTLAGRIRKGTDIDGDRIPEDVDGTEITSCAP